MLALFILFFVNSFSHDVYFNCSALGTEKTAPVLMTKDQFNVRSVLKSEYLKTSSATLRASYAALSASPSYSPIQNYARGPFNNKDCTLTVVMDNFFISAYSSEDEARIQILAAMRQVDQIFKQELELGIPVINVESIGDFAPYNQPTNDISALHAKLTNDLNAGAGPFAQWKQSCVVLFQTAQDFNGVIGLAHMKQNGMDGMCATDGTNVVVTTIKSRGLYLDNVKFYRNTAHELMHAAGAEHDGASTTMACTSDQNPYLMRGTVSEGSNGATLSSCSIQSIQQNFATGTQCLVPRNSAPYLQY